MNQLPIYQTPKIILHLFLFTVLSVFLLTCTVQAPPQERYLNTDVTEIESEFKDLINLWYPTIVDSINGGYWTNFEQDWTRSEQQTKMLVTQSRGLWTAARAARYFKDNPVLPAAAEHGFQFMCTTMWDDELGGFYQYYPPRPLPENGIPYKLTYGNAFALYSLAEYARISSDPAIKECLERAFRWLDKNAYDPEGLGYYSHIILGDYDPADTAATAFLATLGWGQIGGKDQNTSIHLLEALTNVYQVWPDELVRQRLEEMLHLVRDTMVRPEGSLALFFDRQWHPVDHRDSSRTFILENQNYDHRSFGHDIETAYLILDASLALYGAYDPKTLEVAKKLTDHTLAHGFDENYYGLFDRGYRFDPGGDLEIINRQKVWWAQAEAWHTLALMSEIYPENTTYPLAFERMWTYIKEQMIDDEYGGWYNSGLDENPENKTSRKGHQWKGAYHNGRALVQVLEYARK